MGNVRFSVLGAVAGQGEREELFFLGGGCSQYSDGSVFADSKTNTIW